MKIGILTFHFAHNYGAMLQAYALSVKLKMLKYDAEIIDFRLKYIYDNYEKKSFIKLISYYKNFGNSILLSILKAIKNYPHFRFRDKKWNRFDSFLNSVLPKSKQIYNYDEINKMGYSHIILGSDQIWNDSLTHGLSSYYFGVGLNSKKIAYAASNGHDVIPERIWSIFEKYVKSIQCISVREEGLSSFLTKKGVKNIRVLDPIFLLDRVEWNKIAVIPKETDYILSYSFNESPHYFEKIEKVAKSMRKQLICLNFKQKHLSHYIKQYSENGPREFLGFFNNASFVITNSFHGTAFSILFGKQFIVIPPIKRRERVDSLLSLLNLRCQLFEDEQEIDTIPIVEYNKVNEFILRERNKSLDYLLSNLNN